MRTPNTVVTKTVELFSPGVVEGSCRIVGDLYSGSELTRILAESRIPDDVGEGSTKWRRLAQAVSDHQARTGTGKALIALINVALRPDHTLSRKAQADDARDHLNQVLSLAGMKVLPDGKVAWAARATTDDEALDRTTRLRSLLERRGAHERVLRYCRPELLRADYYEAVFEAIKGLGARYREMTGLDADGQGLVEQAMGGSNPRIAVTSLATRTERDAQLGVANLAKGLFGAFRNPAAHEPRLHWEISEQDAVDVLGTLSLIHRRLDGATIRTR